MKKIIALAASTPLALLAEGEPSQTMDTTKVADMVHSAQTGLTGLLDTVTPYLLTLILGGLAIWAGFKVIALVKRAFSRAS